MREPERSSDERGVFTRTFDQAAWVEQGLVAPAAQCSLSLNPVRGTLRGLHFQRAPHAETKLVRCVKGAAFDVALDLRKGSDTFLRWLGVELHPEDGSMLHIPEGCAHGFLTLAPDTEIAYQITPSYEPSASAGVRWDDPAFAISWPFEPVLMSDRDRSYPDFRA